MNVRPLLRVLRGEGREPDDTDDPRFRLTVDVRVTDEKELDDFVDAMHRRWFTAEHADARLANPRDLGKDVAEALVVLNQNPPRIGVEIDVITVEPLA